MEIITNSKKYEELNRSMYTIVNRPQLDNSTSARKAVQSRILLELLEIDEEIGKEFVEIYYGFLSVPKAQMEANYYSLEEYFGFRLYEVGSQYISPIT